MPGSLQRAFTASREPGVPVSKRDVLLASVGLASLLPFQTPAQAAEKQLDKYEPMAALKGKDYGKTRMTYQDYVKTSSGLQYANLKEGEGEPVKAGDTVVVDWDGYTIGYYGRPFEARNKPKGSSFTGDNKEFLRFTLGRGEVIPGFEEGTTGMRVGGIRRIIVPVELGYPDNSWKKQGPAPTTFAGERALGFVLSNKGMIDKTLLFDIELIRVQQ